MNRAFVFVTSLLLVLAISANSAWGQRGRGGGFGGGMGGAMRGGGGGGLRIGGGGGGFRPGGGMSLRSGGGGGLRLSPGMGNSIRSSPGIGSGIRSSAGMGSAIRSSPGIGSIRSSPGIGSAIRSSPGANAFRSTPNLGGGSALSRSLGAGGLNLSRQGNTALRPLTNSSIGSRILSSPGTGARIGGQANLGSRGILSNPGSRQGTGSLRTPVLGRVTSGQLGDFLSLPNRGNLNAGGQWRGSQTLNISRAAGAANFRNLDVSQVSRISNNLNVAFRNGSTVDLGRFNNGFGYGFANNGYWNNWAGGVRSSWHPLGYHHYFTPRFWATNHVHFPWARSYYWWGARPWGYWWGYPGWGALARWILPPYGWQTPCYYGYGPGGNVVYQNGYVYINDQPIATAEDYAASAAELAEVPAPANPDQPVEWMPLGTFALSEGENDTDPSRVVQLAVDKDGTVSGTMVNKKTNQMYPIQGRVDKETQRVAFTIGDNKDVVLETGIYNLTQQQTPVLAHGGGREETYLLLRLDPPKDANTNAAPPTPPSPGLVP